MSEKGLETVSTSTQKHLSLFLVYNHAICFEPKLIDCDFYSVLCIEFYFGQCGESD